MDELTDDFRFLVHLKLARKCVHGKRRRGVSGADEIRLAESGREKG
jgi:hypothetical protein